MKNRMLALAALPALFPIAASAKPINMAAFNSLIGITSPAVSPDGRRVAFLKTVTDLAADKHRSTLEVIDVATGKMRALTSPSTDISSPKWEPSGTAIAYVAQGRNKQDQIFVISAAGGRARQISNAKNGIEQYAPSPDGRTFAYVTQDDPIDAAAQKHHDDLFDIHDDGYLIDGPAQPSHLWLVGANGGRARRLTEGSWSVLEAAPPFVGAASDPSWSRDGKSIAFTQQADADNSDSDRTRIAIVDVRTGAVHMLTDHPKYEYQPEFSPATSQVQYIYPHGPGPVSVMNIFTGSTDVSGRLDRDVAQAEWMPDGKSLIALADDRTTAGLWQQPVNGTAKRLNLGDVSVAEYDVGRSGAIAFVGSNASTPKELYYMATPDVLPVKLTSLNSAFLSYTYGRSTVLQWTAPDGERDDGIVTYPVGYQAGHKYPLVVYSHGGPEAASLQTFGDQEIGRLRYGLTGAGFIVFEPNYRGSDDLGNTHEHGIFADPGVGPGNDVMSGIAALEKTGSVDTNRIAAVGHSYGGYMTTWLIGHAHIWRCAVVADGAVDWRIEYDDSAAGNLAWTRDSLGGTPMDPTAAPLYVSGSPNTYANQITTPTLILSGTADETVPIAESFELYHALADRHIPVRFIGLPGAHHSPSRPVQIDRYYADILQWVERYMH